jgi:hypothetical protein
LIIYVKMFTVLILPVPRLSFNEFKIKWEWNQEIKINTDTDTIYWHTQSLYQ